MYLSPHTPLPRKPNRLFHFKLKQRSPPKLIGVKRTTLTQNFRQLLQRLCITGFFCQRPTNISLSLKTMDCYVKDRQFLFVLFLLESDSDILVNLTLLHLIDPNTIPVQISIFQGGGGGGSKLGTKSQFRVNWDF